MCFWVTEDAFGFGFLKEKKEKKIVLLLLQQPQHSLSDE